MTLIRRKITTAGIAASLLGIGAALPALTAPPAAKADARPNIVFILADDMGNADPGFNGGKQIKTPNIDKIAASGAILKQFYAQPVCSPTRAALLTGRYPMRSGLQVGVVRPWALYGLPLEETTLANALHDAGYRTAITGKWHLGEFQPSYLPMKRGFDHQYGCYNGAIDYFTHKRDGGLDWHRNDRALTETGYSTTLIGNEAVRDIQTRDKSKPFFLYVPFNAVHTPHQVPPRYKKPYADLPEPRQTYAGMTAAMDEAVGTILAEIDKEGLRENTIIVFASDNGGPNPGKVTDNGIYRAGKGTLYEGGVRVAACISWPGKIKPKTEVQAALHMVDWYPTLLGRAGAKPTQKLPIDGRDAWAAITDGKPSPHEAILLNTTPTGGAVRVGDWKLILGGRGSNVTEDEGENAPAPRRRARAGRPEMELYNIAADPSEKNNLADTQPEKLKELRLAYDTFAKQAVPPKNAPKAPGYKVPKVWGEKD